MAGRFDLVRSFVRSAAKAGAERISKIEAIKNARGVMREIKNRRATVTEGALSSAIAGAPDMSAVSVAVSDGQIVVDATYTDGGSLVIAVVPEAARFAPRGAKEVIFRVEPPEMASTMRARDIVGCIAAAIARGLWGPMLKPRDGDEQALVEREGGRLRADLRTVPAVRSVFEGGSVAMALDVFRIESFSFEERALRFRIVLPLPGMP